LSKKVIYDNDFYYGATERSKLRNAAVV